MTTRDELVDAVARKIEAGLEASRGLPALSDADWAAMHPEQRDQYFIMARAAISLVVERCAKVAEERADLCVTDESGWIGMRVAEAVRTLATDPRK